MSLCSLKVSEPVYYHREYKHDIVLKGNQKTTDHSWIDQCKRAACVALPYFSLYKPLSQPLSLAMGGLRTFSSATQLIEGLKAGDAKHISYAMLQTGVAAIALAGTIFAHPLGMLISTGHDLVIEVSQLAHHLQNGDRKKAIESCLHITNHVLYLSLFLHGGIEASIASLAMQVLVGLYHSQDEFKQGRYLEAAGHMGMALIRGKQLAEQVKLLQLKWKEEKTSSSGVSADNQDKKLHQSIAQASWVEQGYWGGQWAHIGHYANGIRVITIEGGWQGIYQHNTLLASTGSWHWETINGIRYSKHAYSGGVYIYTTSNVQYIVMP